MFLTRNSWTNYKNDELSKIYGCVGGEITSDTPSNSDFINFHQDLFWSSASRSTCHHHFALTVMTYHNTTYVHGSGCAFPSGVFVPLIHCAKPLVGASFKPTYGRQCAPSNGLRDHTKDLRTSDIMVKMRQLCWPSNYSKVSLHVTFQRLIAFPMVCIFSDHLLTVVHNKQCKYDFPNLLLQKLIWILSGVFELIAESNNTMNVQTI